MITAPQPPALAKGAKVLDARGNAIDAAVTGTFVQFVVLGAPGATRIITANLHVILNVLDFGMSVSDTVLAPRQS